MTSFSIDEISKQSCSSLVRLLGKRKPIKSPTSAWKRFIKLEGCDLEYPRAVCKHHETTYTCD